MNNKKDIMLIVKAFENVSPYYKFKINENDLFVESIVFEYYIKLISMDIDKILDNCFKNNAYDDGNIDQIILETLNDRLELHNTENCMKEIRESLLNYFEEAEVDKILINVHTVKLKIMNMNECISEIKERIQSILKKLNKNLSSDIVSSDPKFNYLIINSKKIKILDLNSTGLKNWFIFDYINPYELFSVINDVDSELIDLIERNYLDDYLDEYLTDCFGDYDGENSDYLYMCLNSLDNLNNYSQGRVSQFFEIHMKDILNLVGKSEFKKDIVKRLIEVDDNIPNDSFVLLNDKYYFGTS